MYLIVCPTSSFGRTPRKNPFGAWVRLSVLSPQKNIVNALFFFRALHCNPSRKSAAKLQLIMVHQHFFIYFIRQNPF